MGREEVRIDMMKDIIKEDRESIQLAIKKVFDLGLRKEDRTIILRGLRNGNAICKEFLEELDR